MIEHRCVESRCPNCGKLLDSAMPTTGAESPPGPGDISVCLDCHHVSVYGDDMMLRNMTDAEMKEIAGNPDLLLTMKILDEFKRRSA